VVYFPQISLPKPCICTSSLSHTYCMPRPSYSSWFDHPNNTYLVRSTDHTAHLYAVVSTPPVTSSLLGPNIFLSTVLSHTLNLCFSFSVRDQVSQSYKTTDRIIILYIFITHWGIFDINLFDWRSWLRHCTTSQKVAGSIPDGVRGIYHWHNPFCRTMAVGSTQPLTEMSTRNISWGGGGGGVRGAGA
jgi:hypothetical protein